MGNTIDIEKIALDASDFPPRCFKAEKAPIQGFASRLRAVPNWKTGDTSQIKSIKIFFRENRHKFIHIDRSSDGIACVIDWEFMGYKPEFYGAANLIGCSGMENPEGLTGPLVGDFLLGLNKAEFLSPLSRKYLVEDVIALRFAWLSEWLPKGDREMVDLEVVYLKLLREHADVLREAWGFPAG